MNSRQKQAPKQIVRCAIYTRVADMRSDGSNPIAAQSKAAETYVASRQHDGWVRITSRFDDAGFSGANMERPALRRLLSDVTAGRIDCVVIQSIDRLARSLPVLNRILTIFKDHETSLAAVTQQEGISDSLATSKQGGGA